MSALSRYHPEAVWNRPTVKHNVDRESKLDFNINWLPSEFSYSMEDKAERLQAAEGMEDTGKTRPSESAKYSTYEFTETEVAGKRHVWVFSGSSVYI